MGKRAGRRDEHLHARQGPVRALESLYEAHGGERRGMATPFVVVALGGARRLQARVVMQPQLLKLIPDGQ